MSERGSSSPIKSDKITKISIMKTRNLIAALLVISFMSGSSFAQYDEECSYECTIVYCDHYADYCDYDCYEVCFSFRYSDATHSPSRAGSSSQVTSRWADGMWQWRKAGLPARERHPVSATPVGSPSARSRTGKSSID